MFVKFRKMLKKIGSISHGFGRKNSKNINLRKMPINEIEPLNVGVSNFSSKTLTKCC